MKKVLKFIFQLILKTIKNFVMFIISIFILIVLLAAISNKLITNNLNEIMPEKSVAINSNSYLELSFPKDLKEKNKENTKFMSIFNEGSITFYSVIQSINFAKTDNKIKGILIDLDKINLSAAHTEEIIEKIEEFKKSGKKVYAFGNFLVTSNLKMALIADEVVMSPSHSTNFNISGYFTQMPYYKKLLDNIGVEFQVMHIGDFKTYGENYTKEKMSPELKSELTRILDKRYDSFIEYVSKKRNINPKNFKTDLFNGKYVSKDAFDAKEEGLVSSLEYYDDFLNKRGIENRVSINQYFYSIEKKSSENKIAVIYAEGNIVYSNPANPTENVISPDVIMNEIDRAVKDKKVKGIILRVNSPGGVALSAELITHKLIEAKKKKPIYVSMGSTAASGGYYISSNADKIYADEATITGSIGVVSMIFNVEKLLDKIDMNYESLKKGKYTDLYSLQKPLTNEEIKLLQDSQLKIYKEFKQRVINGRGLDSKEVESIAQGKIWLGNEALKNGLIDGIGSLDYTIKAMANHLGLKEYQTVEIVKPMDTKEIFNILTQKLIKNTLFEKLESLNNNIKFIKENHKKVLLFMPYKFK